MKIEMDIDVPDGFEFVRFGNAKQGDWYIPNYGEMQNWGHESSSDGKYMIFRKVPEIIIPDNLKPGWMWKAIDPFDEEESWLWSPYKPTWKHECWYAKGPSRTISMTHYLPVQPECSVKESLTKIPETRVVSDED